MKRTLDRSSGYALAVACASLSMTAVAQESTTPLVLEEIVVTGTNIRGAEIVGSTTQVIGAEEIAASGASTVGDFLREIPANFAGGVGVSDATQSGQDNGPDQSNLAGGQGVNLRGLGALSTLVLINGRRMPTSGQYGDFVDISNIPAAAIERVEILQDGASAVYGSDAVGGVVNFILKKRLAEPVTSVKYGIPTQGGGEELTASQLAGHDWTSGHALFGLEYYTRESVRATDRDRYERGSDFSRFGGINWAEYTAHYSPVTNIFRNGVGGSVSAPVGASVPTGANTALRQSDLILHSDGSGNTTNVYERTDLLPNAERISAFGSFEQRIGERVTLFGDLRYSDRSADYDLGYGFLIDSVLTPASPFYITDIAPNLRNAAGNIAFATVVNERPETSEVTVESYGGQLGAAFALGGDWQLEAAASYGMDDQRRYVRQLANVPLGGTINRVNCALRSTAGVPPAAAAACAALGLDALNPFSTEPLSGAQLDQIFGFEDLSFESYVMQGSLKADGSLFSLPAGAVKVATGVDVRREHIEGFLSWNTGSIETRSGPYTPTERDAVAAFAEFSVPLHDTVELSLAGRYEEFSGTGDYDTFNPKLGINWKPVRGVKLRGSWGTSFHAPPMRFENDDPQPLPGGNAAFLLPASYRGPCDSTIVQFNGVIGTPGTAGQSCSFSVIINSGGAGPGVLEPEEATTWTVGIDFEPESIPGLVASLSYFDIEVEDRIQRIQSGTLPGIVAELFATGSSAFIRALDIRPDLADVQALMNSGKFLGTFGPPLANRAQDVQMIVNATQINIASLRESGFDFSLRYARDVGASTLGLFAQGTWLDAYETQAAPTLPFVDQLGKYSSFGAPVKLRTRQGLSFDRGAFNSQLTVNYTDDYECATGSCFVAGPTGAPVANTSPVEIDSWVTVDLFLGWDLSDLGGFAEGTRIALTVDNLFDEEAPFIDAGTGLADDEPGAYDPNNATILGRTVAVTVSKRW